MKLLVDVIRGMTGASFTRDFYDEGVWLERPLEESEEVEDEASELSRSSPPPSVAPSPEIKEELKFYEIKTNNVMDPSTAPMMPFTLTSRRLNRTPFMHCQQGKSG